MSLFPSPLKLRLPRKTEDVEEVHAPVRLGDHDHFVPRFTNELLEVVLEAVTANLKGTVVLAGERLRMMARRVTLTVAAPVMHVMHVMVEVYIDSGAARAVCLLTAMPVEVEVEAPLQRPLQHGSAKHWSSQMASGTLRADAGIQASEWHADRAVRR